METNTESTAECRDEAEAKDFFSVVRQRLLHVNGWHELAGTGTADFALTDSSGNEVDRTAQQGVQNNHQTKFTRIVRIMETYPKQRFVLLGDSSQHDPYIYEAIVKHFPKRIHAVYIRDVYEKNRQKAADVLHTIEAAGVPCCFFKHSSEAILHSKKIGLIHEKEASAVEKETLKNV